MGVGDSKAELAEAIDRERSTLEALDREREKAATRLARLEAELARVSAFPVRQPCLPLSGGTSVPKTPAEKISLFRSLFRGREDVYALRWESGDGKRSGYAPACSNEWVPGICEKPRVKCLECPHQAFPAISDAVISEHLKGTRTIGVYPLLPDDTCWFLAADLDGEGWKEDIAAFRDTCKARGLPVVIERSRSGAGGHAWFFFAQPVPARLARAVGCALLTETQERRHQVPMTSYDRLFPNQDTVPKGGVGNLIALPLQGGPRKAGNSLFVDETFVPYPCPWEFLAGVRRIDLTEIEALAREAEGRGRVLGVASLDGPGETEEPWRRLPSRASRPVSITGPLPAKIRVVVGARLFVERAGCPSALLARIQRLAAFQNPEFYKRQRMRLSVATTPRIITLAEILDENLALPRGCRPDLEALAREHGIALEFRDELQEGAELELCFRGQLTSVQQDAATALRASDTGVFVAPPGVGKTVVGTHLIAARGRSTLVLVHRRPLVDQWIAQLSQFLGIDPREIGQIGGGKKKRTGRIDVAMIQSLTRKGEVDDLVAEYGHVLVDECHHVPAASFGLVMAEVKARYVTGLTATPLRRDGLHPILPMLVGRVRYTVEPRTQAAARPFEHRLIVRETGFLGGGLPPDAPIQQVYSALAVDSARNELILGDVISCLAEGRSPLVLTERTEHVELFQARLMGFTRHVVVLRGGMSPRERREVLARIAAIPDREERVIVATGRYVGEGFDDARLDTLFLAMPIAWKGTLTQYAGRLHRLHPAKKEVRIYDYVDRQQPVLAAMFEKRLRGYRAIGYARGEAPLGFAEVEERERVIDYDVEDAHRDGDDE